MKNTRKFLAIFMVIAMIMSMGVLGIFADETTEHTITITNNDEENSSNYSYAAYQIFSGTVAEDGELQNLAWGSGIDAEKYDDLIAALKEIEAFAGCKNVVDVATVLGNVEKHEDDEVTMAFADVVSGYLSNMVHISEYDNDKESATYGKHVIDVTGDGYYLVKNTSVPEGETNTTYTRYILQVVKDVKITHKGSFPTVEKKIVESDYLEVDANTSEIGKTINYKFTGTMPTNIADYDTYYYVFTDTMSKGLTYKGNLKVTVNDKDVTDYFYANAEEGTDIDDNKTTVLTVGIEDLLALELITDLDTSTNEAETVGEITDKTTVVVTYDAFVNENAVIGTSGNTNDVNLTYSNDPNDDGEGATNPPDTTPGKPSTTNPTGETPKDLVVTFLTEIKLLKVDGLTNEKLTGAKFKIEGLSSKVAVINKEMFVPYEENAGLEEDSNNVWYRLKDGTYTETKAGEIADYEAYTGTELVDGLTYYTKNGNSYVEYTGDEFKEGLYTAIIYSADEYDGETKYMKVTELDVVNIDATFTKEGWVDEEGILTFSGLGEGEYTITEIIAPDGYNKLETPIKVVVDAKVGTEDILEVTDPTAATKVTWTAKDGTDEDAGNWKVTTASDVESGAYDKAGIIVLEIENTSGSTLPSTGSIGTTIFYVAGGIMVVAAVIFLVTKKRMKNAEN